MKYVVLSNENRVIDILIVNPRELYTNTRYVEVDDDKNVSVGKKYNERMNTFSEYVESAYEITQADRIEANLDYLVLLNS